MIMVGTGRVPGFFPGAPGGKLKDVSRFLKRLDTLLFGR
jgi:hypothetical protein